MARHTFRCIRVKTASRSRATHVDVFCQSTSLYDVSAHQTVVFHMPSASDDEAVYGTFSELFQKKQQQKRKRKKALKKRALHLILIGWCVDHLSCAWPQKPHCSRLKRSLGVHLICRCFSRFVPFNSFPSIGHGNNIAQPKADKCPSSHIIFTV